MIMKKPGYIDGRHIAKLRPIQRKRRSRVASIGLSTSHGMRETEVMLEVRACMQARKKLRTIFRRSQAPLAMRLSQWTRVKSLTQFVSQVFPPSGE
jgi:hypothetical protein